MKPACLIILLTFSVPQTSMAFRFDHTYMGTKILLDLGSVTGGVLLETKLLNASNVERNTQVVSTTSLILGTIFGLFLDALVLWALSMDPIAPKFSLGDLLASQSLGTVVALAIMGFESTFVAWPLSKIPSLQDAYVYSLTCLSLTGIPIFGYLGLLAAQLLKAKPAVEGSSPA